jgi:tellurite resistance protein
MDSGLHSAARALENAFFARENARLLEQLRAKAQHEERRKALREVIRIPDDQLVDHLLELGLGPETVLAVTMVPLAMVAWADGAVQPKEREAILRAAEDNGIAPGSVARQLLEGWLTQAPGTTLVDAWKRYVAAIWPALSPHEHDEIRQSGLERARSVAEAAGGFLGLGSRVSAKERTVLDEIAKVLAG